MAELQIRFAQVDPAAKADITEIKTSPLKPWSVIEDLKKDNIVPPGNYSTLEHNYTILDGSMNEFPNDTNNKTWGLWSNTFSDENGLFLEPPTIDISFNAYHKSRGLTLLFYPHTNDYAKTVRVTWYSTITATTIIKSETYTLNSNIGVIIEPITDFRHIKIEMLSTNIRHRYIKLFAIDYGIVRILNDDEISSCQILEEIDPTGEAISINTINANIRTRNSLFSPVTSETPEDMMMRRQHMTIVRDSVPFGTYFLEEWEDIYQSGIDFNISAGDAMSILDLYTFKGGLYTNVLVSELLNAIFSVAFPTGLIKYELDPVFVSKRLTGWIPICSCGEALQHITFAMASVTDATRSGNIWIYPPDTNITYEIPRTDQYRSGSDRSTDYFSGVDVISHNYSPGTEISEVQNGQRAIGQHIIEFSEPLHSLTITGATIVSSSANYAIINVTTAGNVILSGKRYVDNTIIHSVRSQIIAGETESIKRYENYTMVSANIGDNLAASKFEFLKNRIRSEIDILLDDKEVGYMADLETRGRNIKGTITSLDSNLRANKSTMVVIGNVD